MPERRLRRDLSEDFAEDPFAREDASAGRLRGGVRVRLGGMPRSRSGWIFAGVLALLCAGACVAMLMMTRSFLLHDARFVIASASAIEFAGDQHVSRAQLLNVFGEDVERNIFRVPLEDRRAEVEQMPWVAHATVMRLLPDRLRVSVVERTPVAFVREGNRIGLVDANGVLLNMPAGGKAEAPYSFPVVTGIVASDPLSTRAARMKIFTRFTSDLDSSGDRISQGLSEVDLSNPEDVKALIPDHATDILVHFGDSEFLERYKRFEQHLAEWRTVYPKLSSVDMRYERQVVLEMQPGSGVPMTSSTNAGGVSSASDADGVAKAVPAAHASGSLSGNALAKGRPVVAVKNAKAPVRSAGSKAGVRKAAAKRVVKAKPRGGTSAAKHRTTSVRSSPGAAKYHASPAVRP
ncbi:MAG: FtsQ-type POTRA domain-containing protein [Acidobacteriota bacterium]|nr:FtsQ-type POTRA domain-containing protein [Acidobacteriota bacterium]